jgi:hypothetical protein
MQWMVISAHKSNFSNPIHFQAGNLVEVGKADDEFPGWIWVTTLDGNQGWAPIQYLWIDASGKNATANQPYSAQELDTRLAQVLKFHMELNGWGWVENEDHVFGWVPMIGIQPIK